MSRLLVLVVFLATPALAQDDTDIPPPDFPDGDELPLDLEPDAVQQPLQNAAEDLKAFMQQIAKAKAEEDTGLHAEAAAEDHGEEDKPEEEPDEEMVGPMIAIPEEESVPLEPPVPFLPPPEG
jgi:hypothetical protein